MARNCLATRVRMLSRTITRVYDAALRPHGLTISQLGILSLLENLQPAPSNKVASFLSMEISTLSRNARLMESEGWITIEPSERGNGRVLSLTAQGAGKLKEATPAWSQAQADAKALLGAEDAETITQLVDRVWARQPVQAAEQAVAPRSPVRVAQA